MMPANRLFAWRVRATKRPLYWKVRKQENRLRAAATFATAQVGTRIRESTSISRALAASLLRFIAAAFVAALLVAAFQRFGSYLKDTISIQPWVTPQAAALASWLGQPPPEGLNYQAIISAALAVTGTLVGVYFATVAFVISATYKDATGRVRALITRLPGGRIYSFVYAQAVLFALTTLALPLTGHVPNRLLLSTVTILGGFVVLSFGRLRIQLYGLLEPANLLPLIARDIGRWTGRALRFSKRDRTGSRIRFCKANTLESLWTLRDLCYLIRDRERSPENVPPAYAGTDPRVLQAARQVQFVWLRYESQKQRLATASGWASQRAKHKDWLLSSDTEVDIALATSTTLQAAVVEDSLWLERHLVQIMTELMGGREASQLATIFSALTDPVRHWISQGLFAEAQLWLDTIVAQALRVTTQETLPQAENQDDGSHPDTPRRADDLEDHLYNLVDFVALSYTQAVLGLLDYSKSLTQDFPHWVSPEARKNSFRPLGPVPAKLLANIEDGLQFEKACEGRRVTSDANIIQLMARAVSSELFDETAALMATFENDLLPWTLGLNEASSLLAGGALSRLDEALHKWSLPLASIGKLFELCEQARRDTDDQWPDLGLSEFTERQAKMQRQIRRPIAKLATTVVTDLDPDRPDIFGWAFTRAHQDVLEDSVSSDSSLSDDLGLRLRQLVVATERAEARLRLTVRRQHYKVLGSFRAEPMLMLLQVSGIIYVSALVQKRSDLASVLKEVWGRLLAADARQVLDKAVLCLRLDESLLALSSGKIRRTSRHLAAMNKLEQFGVNRGIEFAEMDEIERSFGRRLGVILHHAAFGDFEETFVFSWLVPAAEEHGILLNDQLLTRRLTQLAESLAPSRFSPSSDPPDTAAQPNPEGSATSDIETT